MSLSSEEMQVSDSESLQSSNFSSAATVIVISDDDDEVQKVFESARNLVPPESSEEEEIRVEYIRFINPPESPDEILRPVSPVQS